MSDGLALLRRLATLTAMLLALDGLTQAVLLPLAAAVTINPVLTVAQSVGAQASTWLLTASLGAIVLVAGGTSPARVRGWGTASLALGMCAALLLVAAVVSGDGLGAGAGVAVAVSLGLLTVGLAVVGLFLRGRSSETA